MSPIGTGNESKSFIQTGSVVVLGNGVGAIHGKYIYLPKLKSAKQGLYDLSLHADSYGVCEPRTYWMRVGDLDLRKRGIRY
jgi:hypothetical protein